MSREDRLEQLALIIDLVAKCRAVDLSKSQTRELQQRAEKSPVENLRVFRERWYQPGYDPRPTLRNWGYQC